MGPDTVQNGELKWNRPEEADHVAGTLLKQAGNSKIWLFNGELGAGKTTLIQALCRALGMKAYVSSPTFSLIQEYASESGDFIYHFDFYRIKTPEEAYETGCEDYFESGSYCFVEWPAAALPFIREQSFVIDIILGKNDERILRYEIL